jgi:hypothetical protein
VLPLKVRAPVAFDERGLTEVFSWRDVSGVVCAHAYIRGGERWIRWPGFAAFRFDDGGIEAFPEKPTDPAHVTDLCRRSVEPIALQALGWETLHASAVSSAAGLVVFCGDCESGKSTLAYSLSLRGYRHFADDSVVMRAGAAGIRALNLPFGVRLRTEAAAFFEVQSTRGSAGEVAPLVVQSHGEISTEPLAAIFAMERTGDPVATAARLEPGTAFVSLLPHSRAFNPNDSTRRRQMLEAYLQIVASVPVYRLRFSAGLERLGGLLDLIERTACPQLATSAV